jgi:hypothetical protein
MSCSFSYLAIEFFSIYLILPAALGPGVFSASNRNNYQKQKKETFLGSRARTACEADNLIAICEPLFSTMWDPEKKNSLA